MKQLVSQESLQTRLDGRVGLEKLCDLDFSLLKPILQESRSDLVNSASLSIVLFNDYASHLVYTKAQECCADYG